jgi:hypothetical protein
MIDEKCPKFERCKEGIRAVLQAEGEQPDEGADAASLRPEWRKADTTQHLQNVRKFYSCKCPTLCLAAHCQELSIQGR